MADIGLQPIQGQEHPALASQNGSQPLIVAQRHGQQLLVALQQVGDAALADHHAPLAQGAVDLRHAAVLAMAKRAHARDHVQGELMLGERNGAFRLGPMGAVALRAGGALATADLEAQPHRPVQGDHGAAVLITDAHGLATRRTLTLRADERAFLLWPGPGLPAGHRRLLAARHPNPQQTANLAVPEKKSQPLWIWKAWDRATGQLVDWECGGRDRATCERLIERVKRWRTRLYCADDYAVYDVLLPVGQLHAGKAETHGIERDNARQRHWLARFRRRSIVVSKAVRMVDVSIALFARFAGNSRIGDLLSMLA